MKHPLDISSRSIPKCDESRILAPDTGSLTRVSTQLVVTCGDAVLNQSMQNYCSYTQQCSASGINILVLHNHKGIFTFFFFFPKEKSLVTHFYLGVKRNQTQHHMSPPLLVFLFYVISLYISIQSNLNKMNTDVTK